MSSLVEAPRRLETERMQLAAPSLADAAEVFQRYSADPEVVRYVGWPRHESLEDARSFVEFSEAEWARAAVGPYLAWSREGRLLGSTGLDLVGEREASTGYVLARDAWGFGYASEALRAMVELARRLGIRRLYALCHPDHEASRHVLAKGGFQRDRSWSEPFEFPNLEPGRLQDVLCYERRLGSSSSRSYASD